MVPQHHALSGQVFEQRFNVAASRARDRMYLVRSVELAELSMTDGRRTLVEHFSAPLQGPEGEKTLIDLCGAVSGACAEVSSPPGEPSTLRWRLPSQHT